MKKYILLFLSVLLCCFPLFAAEPALMFSLAAPSIMFMESGGAYKTDVTENLSQSSLVSLLLPQKIAESEIKLASAFTLNPIRVVPFAWKAHGIFSDLNSAIAESASGSVMFFPYADYENGKVSLSIDYDDVKIETREGKKLVDYSLDGTVDITAVFFTDTLLDLEISAPDISISGDNEASGNTMTIRLFFNEDAVYNYLSAYDIDTARRMVSGILMRSPLFEKLGFDSSSDYRDLILFAEEHNALDLIDAAAFVMLALSDTTLSPVDIFSMAITPVLYENGVESEDIDLSYALDVALLIDSILSGL